MSLSAEFTSFLNGLWKDVNEPTDSEIDAIDHSYYFMAQVNGKPALDYVAEIYDDITGDEPSAVFSHRNQMMLPRIIDSSAWVCGQLEGGKNILDLGSNTAHNLLWWAKKYPSSKFTGIEISEKSLEVANLWKDRLSVENLKLLSGNMLNKHSEIGDEKFDIIINCFALETIPDLEIVNWKIPDWIIESATINTKIIACLTVPYWKRLETIIDTWRGQGFRLVFLDLFPIETGAGHPYFIMDKQGDDLDFDIVEFMQQRTSVLFG